MWASLFTNKAIADGETYWTEPVILSDGMDVHAYEYCLEGVGTITITPYTSISGLSWVSNGLTSVGIGASSGPDSDGKDIVPLRLKPGDQIKFKIVATGISTLTLWFDQK